MTKQEQTSSNRLRPKATKSKSGIKDSTKPKRFKEDELKKRVEYIIDKEVCQVCEISHDLDYPHHAIYGLGIKDDTSLVNICVSCHREIHSGSYDNIKKTRKEIILIGLQNNIDYLSYKGGE